MLLSFLSATLPYVLFTSLLLVPSSTAQKFEGDECVDDGTPGICKQLQDCTIVYNEFLSGRRPTNLCGYVNFEPVVCCPTAPRRATTSTTTTTTTTTTPKPVVIGPLIGRGAKAKAKCAEYARHVYRLEVSNALSLYRETVNKSTCEINAPKYIVGGKKADPKEFPHMTAVGFAGRNTILWLCGGTLISERFVLTAAHCTFTSEWGRAVMVRVGDLNLATSDDNAKPQDIRIIDRIRHPMYKRPAEYHDIALLRLESDVEFNGWVRPACLPYAAPDVGPAYKAIATGWGRVDWTDEEGSNDLLKVTLDLVPQPQCNKSFSDGGPDDKLNLGIVDEWQLCAGKLGKDTCQGDSGGPLAIHSTDHNCMYNVIGVTSLGRLCGSIIPGVYTRVYNYVPWIESIVWPDL